jgi:TRAP-type C4-dicarboxylate transport system permease small subunit
MKWVDGASGLLNRLAAGILFAMMLLTLADVVLRKLFQQGILGTLELTEFTMAAVVFFALAETERLDRNVRVDLVMQRASRRVQLFAALITRLSSGVMCLWITASTLVYAHNIRVAGEMSSDLWIPRYPFIYCAAAGLLALAVVLFAKSLSDCREIRSSWNL